MSKKLFLVPCFTIFFCLSGFSQDQAVLVKSLRGIKGELYIGWYENALDFRRPDKSVFKKILPVNNQDSIRVIFENIPDGTYAIAVFLDENGNGKIDTSILGIPKEKYGFSNNVHPFMRPASFPEAAFSIQDRKKSIVIRLK